MKNRTLGWMQLILGTVVLLHAAWRSPHLLSGSNVFALTWVLSIGAGYWLVASGHEHLRLDRQLNKHKREAQRKLRFKNRTYQPRSLAEEKGCLVLHETAAMERKLWGEIKSKSVADHVQNCRADQVTIRVV